MRKTLLCSIGFALLCGFFPCLPAGATPPRPDELLLIYRAGDKDSRELAEYYAKARGVPADRLLGLNLAAKGEEITAEEYERAVRGPVRAWLEQKPAGGTVRCLVTFYGLPIRVGQRALTPERAKQMGQWRGQMQAGLKDLETAIGELNPTASRPAAGPKDKPPDPQAELQRLREQYDTTRAAFLRRAQAHAAAPEGQAELKKLIEVMQKVEGPGGVVEQVNVNPVGDAADLARQIEAMREGVNANKKYIREVFSRGIDDPQHDRARERMRETYGLAGWLGSLDEDINQVRPEETQAAVDSELALVRWERYPKYRWVVNTMNWRNRAELAARGSPAQTSPVMMVGRIDGPTAAIARGLIDKALAGEQDGPIGNVYIDARGFSASKPGYGPYDEYLRQVAGTIRAHTSLPVRLDNREVLFGPGECPQTVLYCGWYSLRKYVDSFTFVPGAVGYHIASCEAETLRQPGSQVWCKRMLEEGITATLGPVAEPYLQSFPRPDDFLGLLLTGRFTLAEVYAYSLPFHSWMQMLIGDPLYRPFAKSPKLKLEEAMSAEIIPAEYRLSSRPG